MIAPKLNIIKNCDSSMGCWYNSPLYLGLTGDSKVVDFDANGEGVYGRAILADGTMIKILDSQAVPACTFSAGTGPLLQTCGQIFIEVNGAKGPNRAGRDVFVFWITKTGVYPMGSNGDGRACSNGIAFGCTNTVLTQGMNY
jgi:hypothetical protein